MGFHYTHHTFRENSSLYSSFSIFSISIINHNGILYSSLCLCVRPKALYLQTITIFKAVQYQDLTLFDDYVYPPWSMTFAWGLVIGLLAMVPAVYFYRFMVDGGYKVIYSYTEMISVVMIYMYISVMSVEYILFKPYSCFEIIKE